MQGKLKTLPHRYEPGFMRRMDGRSGVSLRLQAAFEAIVEDTGGPEAQSYAKLVLIERFIFLVATLEKHEVEIVTESAKADALMGKWVQSMNAMLGLAKMIGIERQAKAGPTLRAYMENRA